MHDIWKSLLLFTVAVLVAGCAIVATRLNSSNSSQKKSGADCIKTASDMKTSLEVGIENTTGARGLQEFN